MKYRGVVTISWDFESDLSYSKAVGVLKKNLEEFFIKSTDENILFQLEDIKTRTGRVRLGEFPIDQVMPYVGETEKREFICDGIKYNIKMNSQKYEVFKNCMSCVSCGLEGTRIFLEYYPDDKVAHFNLYGYEDDKFILMTKDHIHARAFGGQDKPSNYQTMCSICNTLKGHSNLTLDSVNKLRQLFNENNGKITKKKLHVLIENNKKKLELPWPQEENKFTVKQRKTVLAQIKADAEIVTANCDIGIYLNDKSEMYGRALNDKSVCDTQIGCIKKGTILEPLISTREKIMCKLSENDAVILNQNLVC